MSLCITGSLQELIWESSLYSVLIQVAWSPTWRFSGNSHSLVFTDCFAQCLIRLLVLFLSGTLGNMSPANK